MINKATDQSTPSMSTREKGKKFLEALRANGPKTDKLGETFIARSSKQ